MRSVFPVTALMLLLLANNSFAQQANRVALVIGNSKYAGNGFLRNPANDADAMEAALQPLGFTVIKKKDVNLAELEDAIVSFRRALSKGSVGLFFYAGHGLQVKGENFLVPVGATMREEFEVKRQCLQLATVLEAMTESESNLKIVVLDCCRDDPFKRSWSRSNAGGGLAALTNVPEGTVIAFATSPDKTAADGQGKNSPYTENLVKVLNTRPETGLELRDVFFDASREVKRQTGQIPWLNMEASLEKYYLWSENTQMVKEAPSKPAPLAGISVVKSALKDAQGMPYAGWPIDVFVNELGTPRSDNELNMHFVWCGSGAGPFTMGSPPDEIGREAFEDQVQVTLSRGFYMGKYEVTQSQWEAVMDTDQQTQKAKHSSEGEVDSSAVEFATGPDLPMCFVNFDEAELFCRRFTEMEHAAKRLELARAYTLPTEAQWEFACRAGTKSRFWFTDAAEFVPSNIHEFLWDHTGSTQRVGALKPNPWGLHDMHGNVHEWCKDYFQEKLPGGEDPGFGGLLNDTTATALRNDDGILTEVPLKTIRSGSNSDGVPGMRSASRMAFRPEDASPYIGFRVAITEISNKSSTK